MLQRRQLREAAGPGEVHGWAAAGGLHKAAPSMKVSEQPVRLNIADYELWHTEWRNAGTRMEKTHVYLLKVQVQQSLNVLYRDFLVLLKYCSYTLLFL